eukprot:CCRYP_012132-RA/>CCRYP_012132-RA protein AED:0.30 eAED:0.30 QI:0/-1/0/1/-1/1/1/0/464
MSAAAFKLQQRRRDQERLLQEKESFLRQHHDTERLLDWENRTNLQIQQREVSDLTEKLLREDEEQLHRRQQDIQSLYTGEMHEWTSSLKEKLEVTPEQRMEQLRERAYALKAKREAERQEFVKECYRRQWRDSCDDLRAIDSKATLDRLTEDRKLIMKTKAALSQQDRIDDCGTSHSTSFLQDGRDDGNDQRRQRNVETKQALDKQLQWKREQEAAVVAQRQREEEEQLRHLAHLEQKAKESQEKLMQKSKKEGEDMYKETLQRAEVRERRRRMERDRDFTLLQHALEIERNQIAAEKAKKEEGKDVATEYVQCLREQMKQEANERQQVNAIREEASEKIFKKNDEKLMADAARRRQWMEEVKVSRQEQIRMKEREAERQSKIEEAEVQEAKAALRRQEEAERKKEEQAKAEKIENMRVNKAIMEKMAKDRETEQQEKFLLSKKIQYAEMVHQRKLEEYKAARR